MQMLRQSVSAGCDPLPRPGKDRQGAASTRLFLLQLGLGRGGRA